MTNPAPDNEFSKSSFFSPAGGVFKLVPPPHPSNKNFKPTGMTEVNLAQPPSLPTEFGYLPRPRVVAAPAAAAPPIPPAPPAVLPSPADDEKIIARMQKLLGIEKRVGELEEENDLLIKIVNRLKAENADLKAK